MRSRQLARCLALIASSLLPIAEAFSDAQVDLIRQNMMANATHSWELGTVAQTLLELEAAELSVFGQQALPRPFSTQLPADVLTIVDDVVRSKPAAQLQLVQDGSAADPCSLGVAVLLANATLASTTVDYAGAAAQQLEAILLRTPRSTEGAISHRVEQVQLWSDFVYMAPPFIAYYGAMTSNQSLLQTAYDQLRLYRDALKDPSGCWEHIRGLGSNGIPEDPGQWSSGNGWVAAGMLRVYATIAHSTFASDMEDQLGDIADWTGEILNCAWPQAQSNTSLLRNYVDEPVFADAAASSLLAAVSYRYAALGLGYDTLDAANLAYQSITDRLSPEGRIQPVVNPLSYSNELPAGQTSAEAQSFALLMHAALRDWQYNNVTATATAPGASPSETFNPRAGALGLRSSSIWLAIPLLMALTMLR